MRSAERSAADSGPEALATSLTEGSLPRALRSLVAPMLATSIVAVIFQIADLRFIGALGPAALAAVVLANQGIRQLAFLAVMGLSWASGTVVAWYVGAGDAESAARAAGQTFLIGACLYALLALLGGMAAGPIFELVSPTDEVRAIGVPYLRLSFLLSYAMVFSQLGGAVLTGAGDATTPMRISILSTIVMIAGEWALIFGKLGLPALGVTGVAVGTAAGATVGLVALLRVLLAGAGALHLRPRHFVPDSALLRRILSLAWQPMLQLSTRVVVTILFARLAAGFGTAAQAAFAVGMRVDLIPLALGLPIANAASTLVGQNLGANRPERAARSVWLATTWHAALLWPLAVALLVVPDRIVGFFASDPAVIALGVTYLRYSAVSFFFMAVYMVQFRSLQGAGEMLAVMVISVPILLAVTLPLAYWLSSPARLGLSGLWAASLASIVVVTFATAAWYATGRWKQRRLVAQPAPDAVVES